jgi:hypothetical protein
MIYGYKELFTAKKPILVYYAPVNMFCVWTFSRFVEVLTVHRKTPYKTEKQIFGWKAGAGSLCFSVL